MDLCLISYRAETAFLKKGFPNGLYQGVYFGSYLPEEFFETPLKFILSESLLQEKDFEALDAFVLDLSRKWYKSVTPLGEFVEFDLQLFLFRKLKNLVVLSKLIQEYHPRQILCLDNIGELWPVVKLCGDRLGISVTHVKIPQEEPPPWEGRTTLKAWIIDRLSRWLDARVLWAIGLQRRYRDSVWIDQKLMDQLEGIEKHFSVLSCVFEKGLRVRFRLLKKGNGYFALKSKSRGRIFFPFWNPFYSLWKRNDQNSAFRRFFSFRDIDFYPMVRQELRSIFLSDFPRVQMNIQRFQKITTHLRTRAVVLRNESRELEKSCVWTAKATQARSIVIQHGVFAIHIPQEKIQADINAVWGPFGARYFDQQNHTSAQSVITGNPEYDRLVPSERTKFSQRTPLCQQWQLDPSFPIVVLASQRPHALSSRKTEDEHQRLISAVLAAVSQIPNVQLMIKVHPFEDERPTHRLVQNFQHKDRVRVLKQLDLFSLLAAADAVVTYNSTVGLTAMILEKPVVCVNLTGHPDTVGYVSSGSAVGVYREIDLVPAIQEALWNSQTKNRLKIAQREFVRDYAFEIDGKAKERIFELLRNLKDGSWQPKSTLSAPVLETQNS